MLLDGRAPQELGVDRHDDRAQRHQHRADRRTQARCPAAPARRPPVGWRRRCSRRPTTGSGPSSDSVARLSAMMRGTSRGSLRTSTMSPASTATSVPAPIAMPTSAATRAGASFTPSPDHRDPLPRLAAAPGSSPTLSSGSTSANTVSIPSSAATASATAPGVTRQHDDLDALLVQLLHGLGFDSGRTTSATMKTASACTASAPIPPPDRRRSARAARLVHGCLQRVGNA